MNYEEEEELDGFEIIEKDEDLDVDIPVDLDADDLDFGSDPDDRFH
ncbi:MAG TPA: hypothetical protein VFQ59_03685 [Candidatus Paceibacterota bacterium]|nr:hypothetical protein [Candidatus Paceibacterota bacterium]